MDSRVKIFLADLAHDYSVDTRSLTVPLNIGYVKAYARWQHGGSAEISLFKQPEKFLQRVTEEQPHIIGFSNYGWNENLNRSIGQYVRNALPSALIVAGGPNIDPGDDQRHDYFDRHSYVDFVVIDGGEEPFSEMIEWWLGSRDPAKLPQNILWRDMNGLHFTGERKLSKTIDNILSPYLDGSLDEFLSLGMVPMFETNRGCPFKCTFCAWGSASKDLVRRLDVNIALAELEYVGERSDALNWIICDANFGILKRDVEIARAIRRIKDRYGRPEKCHIWLAKNVTERNLEIGEILGDMTVPVMAVQSLDSEVLRKIKRDNIATETYVEYQSKFHSLGSQTYSDLIVPLPAETLESHVQALRNLCDYGVDIIMSHNMRLLAGAETNTPETRKEFGFRTRFRLIHGDAGVYKTPDGHCIRAFEYEESLRETTTMNENDLFFLRKLHFLVDLAWNVGVYKPLLQVGQFYGINPIDALLKVKQLDADDGIDNNIDLKCFFNMLDDKSTSEWFDSREDIEDCFADTHFFDRLIAGEFEKLNILFGVILLRDFKLPFDRRFLHVMRSFGRIPEQVLIPSAELAFAAFPSMQESESDVVVELPDNLASLNAGCANIFRPSQCKRRVRFSDSKQRRRMLEIVGNASGRTLSKILNTQGLGLAELRRSADQEFAFDLQLRSVG